MRLKHHSIVHSSHRKLKLLSFIGKKARKFFGASEFYIVMDKIHLWKVHIEGFQSSKVTVIGRQARHSLRLHNIQGYIESLASL